MRAVLVAAKQLAFAKTRLAAALPAAGERAALAAAMFRDVLSAALGARLADKVAVVTSDPMLLGIAEKSGAWIVDERFPRGLNVAVRIASEELKRRGVETVCTVLSDIPLVTGEDIDAVFGALPRGERAVVLVPSRDFSGTNMIARTPPDVIPTKFGSLSLVRHLEDCRERSVACEVLRRQGPALDLDLPADLIEFARMPSMTHTHGHLARLGLIQG